MFRFEYKISDNDVLIAETQNKKYDELNDFPEKGLESFPEGVCFQLKSKYKLLEEKIIGHFYFSPMPGCCGIIVSHHTYLNRDKRSSGFSEPFRNLKEELAKKLGYTRMIATTQMDNVPGVKNMFKSKYRIVDTFTNKRTGNLLGLGIKRL